MTPFLRVWRHDLGEMRMMRPCGMCQRLCSQCEQQHAQLKAEFERQGERVTALEIAFAEAGDDERGGIGDRLQDSIEVWWGLGEEIDILEGGDDD